MFDPEEEVSSPISLEDFRDAMDEVDDLCSYMQGAQEEIVPRPLNMESATMHTTCHKRSVMRDALNMPWCEEHQFRGEFVNRMAAHRWIGLKFHIYRIAPHPHSVLLAVLTGSEEMIGQGLAAVEMPECWYSPEEEIA